MAPAWEKAATKYNFKDEGEVLITNVDCTQEQKLCQKNGVRGYPTVKSFIDGVEWDDKVPRSEDGIDKYIVKLKNGDIKKKEKEEPKKEEKIEDRIFKIKNQDDFDTVTKNNEHVLVKFFAPWCGHCKNMANDWKKAGLKYNKEGSEVVIAEADCTGENAKKVCSDQGVRGYPTLKHFENGEEKSGAQIPRNLKGIGAYVDEKCLGLEPKVEEPAKPKSQDAAPETHKAGSVHKLTSHDFDKFVTNNKDKNVFIKVYAPWCGHCKNMAPAWIELAKSLEDKYDDVIIAEYDATSNESLKGGYAVRGFPTLFWAGKDSKDKPEKYQGARSIEAWTKFVDDKVPVADEVVEEEVQEEKEVRDEL